MDLFNFMASLIFHTSRTVFANTLFLDNDPGLYVCGIPITIIWLGLFCLVLQARHASNRTKKKGQ